MKSQHVFLMSSDLTQVTKAKYKHFFPFFFPSALQKNNNNNWKKNQKKNLFH